MTFKQGKFYVNGEIVPLQFGNSEQIKIIEAVKTIKNEGFFYAGSEFECFCGLSHHKPFNEGEQFKCECGAVYKFYYWNEEIPTLKML